ncbi:MULTISPECIES: calcium:proton antiporter [Dermacoccus]|uniref:calcium:proton antiporter n=1 Tax=Dermacoccus TaxID=57495 RepID=UPI00093C42DD|nr:MULTISPECIES: ionic transporter y4hA [Dermacoccus]MBO1757761.1 ionic transporter y4hA [Dermacoccus sp. NHGro5]
MSAEATHRPGIAQWTTWAPILGAVVLAATWGRSLPGIVAVLVTAALFGAVLAAVHHAEVIAAKVGEPLGSIVLAVAVTVIEVGLIVTLMASGKDGVETLARDTVFAALMITINGIAGLCIFLGAGRRGLARFNPEGSAAALAGVVTVAGLCLVLPTFTSARSGPEFSPSQLAFAAISSIGVYAMFVLTQTVRHRDFFVPVDRAGKPLDDEGDEDAHGPAPSTRAALVSLGLLVVALVAVVGLAKVLSPSIEQAVDAAGFPQSFVGVVIALVVLLPETLAAAKYARAGRVQNSLNLAYGSAMASIGLTIPTLAALSPFLSSPLELGLGSMHIVLLVLSLVVGILTIVQGRATRFSGWILLVLLFAYVFLAANP